MQQDQVKIWIQEARKGDHFSLAKLLTACDPWLRKRTNAGMDAGLQARGGPDDILQETYLEVVNRLEHFEGNNLGAFLNWVGLILDHKLIDAHRAGRCQARDVAREMKIPPAAADSYWNLLDNVYLASGTPSRVIRRQEALEGMVIGLAELSDLHRQVIQLRFLEGLNVTEVAQHLNKSEDAIVALTRRALEALRKAMNRLGEFTRGN